MVPLSCPLCCNETFSSHLSLKYHILGLIENIFCPSCDKRCENLGDLAEHLGKDCTSVMKSEKYLEDALFTEKEAQHGSYVEPTHEIKQEPEDISKTVNTSLEASKRTSLERNEIQDDPNMIYTCEMCDVTFTSVQEHLGKYHEGEEVLLETEEHEEIADGEEDGPLAEQMDDIFDEDGSIVEENMDNISERTEFHHTESTTEEHLMDSEGMPYTRRVVKVGNDWTEETRNSTDNTEIFPATTKYIVEDGQVVKISDEEAAEINDKSKVIEIHTCSNCQLQFPNISHFRKHNCSSEKQNLNKKAERQERKTQMLKIKEEFRYQCTFCLAIYSSLIALNDHMKLHLVQDDTGMVQKKTITMSLHICGICNTKFPTYKQLRLHARMHEPIKAKEVDPPVSYNMMGQHNEENIEPGILEREKFECPICEKFYDKEYEEVHMKYHEEEQQYICLVCNRKFDSKDNLDMHTKAHSNTKKFACSYCKKSFTSYAALEDHVTKQCQKRDFECQYCGRRFSRPHEKVKHERIHTGEKPHVCEVCGKSFRVGYCLTLHMRTHTGNRPYTCHRCGKRFKSHGVFNHHMKTHSDDRNYKCPFCPKAFKTAVQLAGHKNSHTKPFSCTECNRPFASLYAVRAHMDTHKRDNNLRHKCWMCGASYARSFALRDHMEEAHGKENNENEQTLTEFGVVTEETPLENIESQTSEEPFEENEEQKMTAENGEY